MHAPSNLSPIKKLLHRLLKAPIGNMNRVWAGSYQWVPALVLASAQNRTKIIAHGNKLQRSLGKRWRIKKGGKKQPRRLRNRLIWLRSRLIWLSNRLSRLMRRAARVELVLDKFMGNYNQQQTQADGFSFTPSPLPTPLVPAIVSAPIPDPYSDPNRYYIVMNPGSSRIPKDDEDGDDQDGNDEDGIGNNEDGNGSDESSSASDAE
ncbi:hypothetical protein Tco_1572298, partial [Tanacetum coccineum]